MKYVDFKTVQAMWALTLVIVTVLLFPGTAIGKASTAATCSSFPNQAAAQDALPQNPKLDGDGDGIACESLPCPCSTADPAPAPVVSVVFGGKKVQSAKKGSVVFTVKCPDEDCTARASGNVNVPKVGKRASLARKFKLKRVKKSLAVGQTVKLKLKFSKKTRAAVRRALKTRKKVKVKVKITVTNASGAAKSKRYTVKLKR